MYQRHPVCDKCVEYMKYNSEEAQDMPKCHITKMAKSSIWLKIALFASPSLATRPLQVPAPQRGLYLGPKADFDANFRASQCDPKTRCYRAERLMFSGSCTQAIRAQRSPGIFKLSPGQ